MLKNVELAVSSMAFPVGEFEAGLDAIAALDVGAVEIAPYDVFGAWSVDARHVDSLRKRLDDRGIRCVALQGIVFKAGEAHLFASVEGRQLLLQHLTLVAKMAGRLGAAACVFGAPRLRDPGELEASRAWAIAIDFFEQVGPIFASEGSVLSFEPNSARYACRFITTTREAIEFVRSVGTPGVKLQIDTGTAFLENESPETLISAVPYAAHAHVSEPHLAAVGTSDLDHRSFAEALRKSGYTGSLSIEMKKSADWRSGISRAAAFTREVYFR